MRAVQYSDLPINDQNPLAWIALYSLPGVATLSRGGAVNHLALRTLKILSRAGASPCCRVALTS
jgi:hypothetical protein